LFDEVEKAHPDVWNVLLQVLDDGRLTDSQGRTIDFTNTIIILTSNIGSQHITAARDDEQIKEAVLTELKASMRPELLNRLDEMVVFHQLGREQLRNIVDIQLSHFRKRLAGREISLEVTAEAKDLLGNLGYDPTYGARPLKRVIQRQLENPLAEAILSGKFGSGDTVVVGAGTDGHLTLSRTAGESSQPNVVH
jgi:ATP-dependent Clp protease ATP-binding subunit ClpB